ncbi:cyclic nucleotide-binding domain-containing protein [candidate division KSB1 bacterium]
MLKEDQKQAGALVEIQKILSMAEEKIYKPDEIIFEEGEDDSNFYILLKGSIEISKKTTDGEPKVIAQVSPGEFLGEGVLSGLTKKPASAKSVEESVLMVLSYANFEKLIQEDSRAAVDFLITVLEAANSRLTKTNTKLLALYEISQLLHMHREDLNQLASGLVNKLVTITDSKDGILFLKNPFEGTYRAVYSSSPELNEEAFKKYDLSQTQKVVDENGQFLIANLNGMGTLSLRRDADYAHYDADQLRLLILIAEQAAHIIREASAQASEKAKKMLQRKHFEL